MGGLSEPPRLSTGAVWSCGEAFKAESGAERVRQARDGAQEGQVLGRGSRRRSALAPLLHRRGWLPPSLENMALALVWSLPFTAAIRGTGGWCRCEKLLLTRMLQQVVFLADVAPLYTDSRLVPQQRVSPPPGDHLCCGQHPQDLPADTMRHGLPTRKSSQAPHSRYILLCGPLHRSAARLPPSHACLALQSACLLSMDFVLLFWGRC